jgi:hypothetical protein
MTSRHGHDVPVVEADQRHIVGDAAAGGTERVGHAAGDLVAAAEDGHASRHSPNIGGPTRDRPMASRWSTAVRAPPASSGTTEQSRGSAELMNA